MTRLLPADAVEEAGALLRAGQLVAFPTETVYGLGADARNAAAVAAIYEAKGRPSFNPLISHFAEPEAAFEEVVPDERARLLARHFWPGPLTLVLPRSPRGQVSQLAGAGLETLAVRVPGHEQALAVLRAAGVPIAAPSANPSGGISPTSAQHVLDGLSGRIAAVLEGANCTVGVESTVLDLTGPIAVLLRPGAVTTEAIEALLGERIFRARETAAAPKSPGMLLSHYAPTLPVRINAVSVDEREALLAFGPPMRGAALTFQLSAPGDTTEAATRLFQGLRELDAQGQKLGLDCIAVMAIPMAGLGEAINDRLTRAAAPR
ncbi:threonylcarbamoyl-AMP synthase [Acetobacteraceae bacterium H6797]|nr:threonylcarbamoyl-AMP synthase [Acetobacteraceae bacterium H6797]